MPQVVGRILYLLKVLFNHKNWPESSASWGDHGNNHQIKGMSAAVVKQTNNNALLSKCMQLIMNFENQTAKQKRKRRKIPQLNFR